MKVYLAGPITGLSYSGCTDWREYAIAALDKNGIQGLSPLRGKEYLKDETSISDNYNDGVRSNESLGRLASVMSSQRGIYYRDKFDCERADFVIVNMLGAERVSIGTVMEIAWAAAAKTPIVLIMEKDGNIHEHSMLREACAFRVDNLDDALHVTTAVLAPRIAAKGTFRA
jgi:nucleoside 2-deoxyribosyltransferase